MGRPVDSFTLAMVGMAPANTESASHKRGEAQHVCYSHQIKEHHPLHCCHGSGCSPGPVLSWIQFSSSSCGRLLNSPMIPHWACRLDTPLTAMAAITANTTSCCLDFSPIQPNNCHDEEEKDYQVPFQRRNNHWFLSNSKCTLLLVVCFTRPGGADLFGADQRCHDAHVGGQEELQAHDEDGQDGERHQLQTVVHELQNDVHTKTR